MSLSVVFCITILSINLVLWFIFFLINKRSFSAEKLLEKIRSEINKMLIDINREADRSITLIDARRKGLQKLLDDAKRYVEIANGELDKRARSQNLMNTIEFNLKSKDKKNQDFSKKTPIQGDLFFEKNDENEVPFEDQQEDIVDVSDIAKKTNLEKGQFLEMPQVQISENIIQPQKDLRTQVLELAAEGFSLDIIARKMKISIMEVELIVNMYN